MNVDNRIAELEAAAGETGIPLPRPAAEIVALEDAGAIVDLVTGEVIQPVADHAAWLAGLEQAGGGAVRVHWTITPDQYFGTAGGGHA